MPSADVLTADMPTAELTALQRSAPPAHIGFAIAQAAACAPWSGYVPSLPHASYIEAKDTLRQLAYRCAYCWRATSCRMAVTRVRCQRVAASRDAGLYAQWAQGSRVRDLCIQPVWHMRRTMAWAPGGFKEHFEIVVQLPLGPVTALKQKGSATSFEAQWSFPVAEREQGRYAEKRGGRQVKGRYHLDVRWPSRVIWEDRFPCSTGSSLDGVKKGWVRATQCSHRSSRSMQHSVVDRNSANGAIVTFQVPIQRRESSLLSILARKEGEEGRGLHAVECPCEMCDEWRERMVGASNEDEWMLSGFVVESEAEPESDVDS